MLRIAGDSTPGDSSLTLYTTMATWCLPCRAEIPHLEALRSRFGVDEVAMYALPVDPKDSLEMLDKWMQDTQAPYVMLSDWKRESIQTAEELIFDQLKAANIPASMIADREGNVLLTRWGAPTLSEIAQLLEGVQSEQDATEAAEVEVGSEVPSL